MRTFVLTVKTAGPSLAGVILHTETHISGVFDTLEGATKKGKELDCLDFEVEEMELQSERP